jgi:hypothetical protein
MLFPERARQQAAELDLNLDHFVKSNNSALGSCCELLDQALDSVRFGTPARSLFSKLAELTRSLDEMQDLLPKLRHYPADSGGRLLEAKWDDLRRTLSNRVTQLDFLFRCHYHSPPPFAYEQELQQGPRYHLRAEQKGSIARHGRNRRGAHSQHAYRGH